jgi:hypothetical protein
MVGSTTPGTKKDREVFIGVVDNENTDVNIFELSLINTLFSPLLSV